MPVNSGRPGPHAPSSVSAAWSPAVAGMTDVGRELGPLAIPTAPIADSSRRFEPSCSRLASLGASIHALPESKGNVDARDKHGHGGEAEWPLNRAVARNAVFSLDAEKR